MDTDFFAMIFTLSQKSIAIYIILNWKWLYFLGNKNKKLIDSEFTFMFFFAISANKKSWYRRDLAWTNHSGIQFSVSIEVLSAAIEHPYFPQIEIVF